MLSLFLLLQLPPPPGALRLVFQNLESGGASIHHLTRFVAAEQGCHLWGFAEVLDGTWAEMLEKAAEEGEEANFSALLGKTGHEDRLLILYSEKRLELLKLRELHHINPGRRVRSPLLALFRDRTNGTVFYFMVNHLYRKDAQARAEQARQLNEWAARAEYPMVAVGDYNFDWEVLEGESNHDPAFDHMVRQQIFRWIRPNPLRPSHTHRRYATILDFLFLSQAGHDWQACCEIVEGVAASPKDKQASDHAPLRAWLLPPNGQP